MLCGFTSHQHGASDIGGKHAFEAAEIHLGERLEHADTGVIDEDVEVIELAKQLLVAAKNIALLPDIGVDGVSSDRSTCGVEPLLVAAGNGDLRTSIDQRLRYCQANAARPSCHQRRRTFEVHSLLSKN